MGRSYNIFQDEKKVVFLSTLSIATGTTIDTILIGRNHTLFLHHHHHHLLLKGGYKTAWLFEAIVRTERTEVTNLRAR